VIDLQNGFMEQGAPVEVPAARDIVANVNRISAAMRQAGGLNIFVRFVLGEETLKSWSVFYERMGNPEAARTISSSFAADQHYAALWPKLEVAQSDLRVTKHRFSAFIPGTCDLHDILQRRGIDTLIVTGTLTNVCCESSARDAQQMNYRILFASDATAARTLEAHNAAIENMSGMFADVANTTELVSFIDAARSARK
jgi:ureidoacrylate peracid hydrolase